MQNTPLEIVDHNFVVLRKEESSFHYHKIDIQDFVTPIINSIPKSFSTKDFDDLRDYINEIFKLLDAPQYSYCTKLDSKYQDKVFDWVRVRSFIISWYETFTGTDYNAETGKDMLIKVFSKQKNKINYFVTYQKLRNDPINRVISNRRSGWHANKGKITLSKSLICEIQTNFGYGKSSYFYLQIRYKGIPIKPYMDYIKYEVVNAYEIIRYTQKYYHYHFVHDQGKISREVFVYYEGWNELMQYLEFISNLNPENLEAYIEKITTEGVREMIAALKSMFDSDTFTFTKSTKDEKGYVSEHTYQVGVKEGLLSYRTEKIFGILPVLDDFVKLPASNLSSTLLSELLDLCEKQYPTLIKEKEKLIPVLATYHTEFKEIEDSFDLYMAQNKSKITTALACIKFEIERERTDEIIAEYEQKKEERDNAFAKYNRIVTLLSRAKRYQQIYLEIIKDEEHCNLF